MQNLNVFLRADSTEATVVDSYNQSTNSVASIVRGMQAQLNLGFFKGEGDLEDMRFTADVWADYSTFELVFGHDFDDSTAVQIRVNSGISVGEDGKLIVPVLETNTVELINLLGNQIAVSLWCELTAYKAGETKPSFVAQWKMGVRNRVDMGGAEPTALVENFYTVSQVNALLSAAYDVEFSADGVSWHSPQVPETDKHFRFRNSQVEGAEWSTGIQLPEGAKGAKGDKGDTPIINIDSETKHWIIDGVDTEIKAEGADAIGLPAATAEDVGKVAIVDETGAWSKGALPATISIFSEMPETAVDGAIAIYVGQTTETYSYGDLYRFVDGVWTLLNHHCSGETIPEDSSSSGEESSSSSSEEPDAFTYRSYDVADRTVTLFANNVDLADYQYNTDGLDARPVPDGFKAVSGIGDKSYLQGGNTVGSFSGLAISDAGQLYMKDPSTGSWAQIDPDTTWTAVAGFACSSVWYLQTYAYAIKDGGLYSVKYDRQASEIFVARIGTDSDWTAISGYSSQVLGGTNNQWFAHGFGIRDGKLYKLSASTATQVGISAGWTAVSGVAYQEIIGTENPTYYKAIAYGICDGRLYHLPTTYGDIGVVAIGTSSDWTFISGYGFSCFDSSYVEGSYDLCTYGICGGQLHRVMYDSENIGGDKTDWYRVWMVEPNEAVAIDGTPVEESSSSEEESSSGETGTLVVNIEGTTAGRWTIDSGNTWHESGVTLHVLAGSYGVQFEPVNGYTTPFEQIVTVSAGQTTSVSAGYVEEVPSEQVDTGSIRVSIIGTSQGRWSIDQGETWHSGDYARVLVTGNYTVTFKNIDGYDTPADQHVTIAKDETLITHGQYTESLAAGTTSLRVHIFGADTGQWSIDDGVTWNDGGDVLSPAAGNYTVTLKPVSGYDTPESFEVVVEDEIAVERNVFYLANIALGGYGVYNLNADGGPALLADGVNPESSSLDVADGNNLMVINGAIVALYGNNYVSLNLGNQWKSAVGYYSVDADTGKVIISANAITNDGKLYGLLKAESDDYIRMTRVDDASDWVGLPEINYFKKTDGSLWHYRSGNADLIKMGDHWDVVGKGILGNYSVYIVTDGADKGKVFIGINTAENDIRQLGSASNWKKVSSAIPGLPLFGGGVSKQTSYLINSSGELHIVYNNTNYDNTPIQYSFSTSRIGTASNWVDIKGSSYKTGYSSTEKYYAWALNSQGELYALQEKTLTYMGNGFADAIICRNYVLKSNGQLYALSTSSATNPTCVLQEHFDDWTMISGKGVGMRNTEVDESSSSGEDLSNFTFNSFELDGTTLTDFATGVDIADYQYNSDGLDLQILPDGYKAISGEAAGMSFPIDNNPISIAIDGLGMLRMEDPATGFFEVIDSGTTWAKVSGVCSSYSYSAVVFAYALKTDGTLWAVNIDSGSPAITQVGVATDWTAISGYSYSSNYKRAFGICDGALYHLSGTTATRIGISSSWTAVTGFSTSSEGSFTTIGFGIAAGNLYVLAPSYADGEPVASLLDSAGTWTKVSGFGQVAFSNGDYRGDYIWSTVYGIRDGSLMGIVGGYSYSEYELAYTVEVIDSIRTYHDVWLLSAGRTYTESTGIAVSKVPVE